MNPLDPVQVSDLLRVAGSGSPVHLIGAGGCGMSGLGHLLLDLGHTVTGSDLASNKALRQLRARGALIHIGHAAEQIQSARPVLVAYSSAIRSNNPELLAARQANVPIVRRATLLAALVQRQRGICVAGMHGKTTTSALLGFALEHLQARPSYAIGALVAQLERHARFSHGAGQASFLPSRGRDLQVNNARPTPAQPVGDPAPQAKNAAGADLEAQATTNRTADV